MTTGVFANTEHSHDGDSHSDLAYGQAVVAGLAGES